MTFKTLFADLQIYAIFLVVGFLLREYIPLCRRLFLPASVLGGLVALIGGPQVLGLWSIPKVFGQFANELIVLVVTTILLGLKFDRGRVESYMDYFCASNTNRFGQIGLGILVGIVLRYFWKDLPPGWGLMAFASFLGGHGTAATYGNILKELGQGTEYTDIGMILSTLGLVVAVVVGTIIVNRGVRRGYAAYLPTDAALRSISEHGLLPKEKRTSLGTTLVYNSNVNNLAFQFALLMIAIFLGKLLCSWLATLSPYLRGLPNMFHGIFGALIVNGILKVFKASDYVDRKTCNTIAQFSMELMVLCSVATLNLKVLSAYWVPMAIITVVVCAFCGFICFWYFKRISVIDWFEKGVYQFGNYTGSTSTGLLLLRVVDPESKSIAFESSGPSNAASKIVTTWIPAVIPVMAVNTPWMSVGVCLALSAVFFVMGWVMFRKKVKKVGR